MGAHKHNTVMEFLKKSLFSLFPLHHLPRAGLVLLHAGALQHGPTQGLRLSSCCPGQGHMDVGTQGCCPGKGCLQAAGGTAAE